MICHFCQLHCTYFNAPCICLILCTNWKTRKLLLNYLTISKTCFSNFCQQCLVTDSWSPLASDNKETVKSVQIIVQYPVTVGPKYVSHGYHSTNVLIVLQLGRDQKGLKPIRNSALGANRFHPGHLATSHSPIARSQLEAPLPCYSVCWSFLPVLLFDIQRYVKTCENNEQLLKSHTWRLGWTKVPRNSLFATFATLVYRDYVKPFHWFFARHSAFS